MYRNRRKLPVVLTQDELQRLLRQPNRRVPTGLRNYVMMLLMARGGLRVGEVLALQTKHVDLGAGLVRVYGGKGDVDRTIPVEPWVADALKAWLSRREELRQQRKTTWRGGKSGAVFTTLQGEGLDDRYVRAMVKREAQAAGIEKDVHPHTLRHTYATQLLEDGLHVKEVQDLLGHAYLDTTAIYLHVNPVNLAEKIRARPKPAV